MRAEIGHCFLIRMHMVLFGGKRHGASEMSLRGGATVCFAQSCHRWDSPPEGVQLSLALAHCAERLAAVGFSEYS